MVKQYFEKSLPNGLKIIVGEDVNSDTFTISALARAGSRYEKGGEYGYAHLLEHMLLKGTKSKPSAFDIGVVTDRAGALYNASTNTERVQIYIQAARSVDEEMTSLIADMVINPLLNSETLENEKKVVLQEIKESQDDDARRLYMEMAPRVFEGHPLAHIPLGAVADVRAATEEKLQEYHKKFFVANNMAVVITGGLTHERAFALCEKYFAEIPTGVFADNTTPPPLLHGSVDINFRGSKTAINLSFIAAKLDLKESQVMEVIRNFLGYRQTSLLNQELRQKRGLVYSVFVTTSEYSDSFLFSVRTATTDAGIAEEIVLDNVFNLEKFFTPELFEEYKKQTINIILRELSDEMRLNNTLKYMWYVYGKLIPPKEIVETISAITYKDMLDLKNKIFRKDNLFVVRLVPPIEGVVTKQ